MPYSCSWGRGMLLVAPDRTHLTRARRMLPMASVFLSPPLSPIYAFLITCSLSYQNLCVERIARKNLGL